jgi:hypothetical protein
MKIFAGLIKEVPCRRRRDEEVFRGAAGGGAAVSPADRVWTHLRGVFADRGATEAELAESMIAAGAADGDRDDVVARLERLLGRMLEAQGSDRRVERLGARYRALPA